MTTLEAAHAIADALKVNSTMESLDLSHNRIQEEAVSVIAEILKHNPAVFNIIFYEKYSSHQEPVDTFHNPKAVLDILIGVDG